MVSSASSVASIALLISLNFIMFGTVISKPQREHNFHITPSHNHSASYAIKSTAIHVAKPTAVAIYETDDDTTVIRPLNDNDYCPRDAMKMHCCVDLLGDIFGIVAGKPGNHTCCSALFGLIDIEAAMCLCTTIKANILGFTIDLPIRMTLLLNFCNKPVPKGFTCK